MYTDFLTTIIYNDSSWETHFSLVDIYFNSKYNSSLLYKPSINTLSIDFSPDSYTVNYSPELSPSGFFENDNLEASIFYKDTSNIINEDITENKANAYFSLEVSASKATISVNSSSDILYVTNTSSLAISNFKSFFVIPALVNTVQFDYHTYNKIFQSDDLELDFQYSVKDSTNIRSDVFPFIFLNNIPQGFLYLNLFINYNNQKTLVISSYCPTNSRGFLPTSDFKNYYNSSSLIDIGWNILGLLSTENYFFLDKLIMELLFKYNQYSKEFSFSTLPSSIIRIDPIIIDSDVYKFSSYSLSWLGLCILEYIKHTQDSFYSYRSNYIDELILFLDSIIFECLSLISPDNFLHSYKAKSYTSSELDYGATLLCVILFQEYLSIKYNEDIFVAFIKLKSNMDDFVKQNPTFFINNESIVPYSIYCIFYNYSFNYSLLFENLGNSLTEELMKKYLDSSYNISSSLFVSYNNELYSSTEESHPTLLASTIYLLKSKPFIFTKTSNIDNLAKDIKGKLEHFTTKALAALPKQNKIWFREDIYSQENNTTKQLIYSALSPLIHTLANHEYHLLSSFPNTAVSSYLKSWAEQLRIEFNPYCSESFLKELVNLRLSFDAILNNKDLDNLSFITLTPHNLPSGTYSFPFLYKLNGDTLMGLQEDIYLENLDSYRDFILRLVRKDNEFVYKVDNYYYLISYITYLLYKPIFENKSFYYKYDLAKYLSTFFIKINYDDMYKFSCIQQSFPIGFNWKLDVQYLVKQSYLVRSIADD